MPGSKQHVALDRRSLEAYLMGVVSLAWPHPPAQKAEGLVASLRFVLLQNILQLQSDCRTANYNIPAT